MVGNIDASSILRFHDRQLQARDWPVLSRVPAGSGAWEWIAANHRYNGLLWLEEERARRLDLPPAEIAAGQRLIGRYRQKRGAAADAIGAALAAPRAGALVDHLSRLALQIHRLRTHALCPDVDPDHLHACASKLDSLLAQRRDLAACLAAVLDAGLRHAHQ